MRGGRQDVQGRRRVQAQLFAAVYVPGRRVCVRVAVSAGGARAVAAALPRRTAGRHRRPVLPRVGLSARTQHCRARRLRLRRQQRRHR